ncbi:PREDICTED: cyclin-D1-1-like isoform X2 [Nelumbo nucifera]|uniref:Cyclin-D1-1-like isoform X2 n=1 Tax=Nelumbo nucifera TaxID=4432 RepID=A0A1U8AV65_NELNU|nr:PREDICTED: cyclin-D1-1-like isoform X2 [Nelumbo nucifera]
MSLSYSDCSSDLLCCEDAGVLDGDLSDYSQDIEYPADTEESIAGFIEDERDYMTGCDYTARFQSRSLDASARQESVEWILKQAKGWPLQLLSAACLSLAAKMEEPLVPSLLDLQVEATKFIFEPRTIQRMELLVLSALDWRLRSITPFNFVNYFAYKVDSSGTLIGFLVSRATEIILAIIREINFLKYRPSSVAAGAILCAAKENPNLSLVVNPGNAVSWCDGLCKVRMHYDYGWAFGHVFTPKNNYANSRKYQFLQDRIVSCYRLMQQLVLDNRQRKPPRVLQQLRVTTPAGIASGDSSSSSSSSCNKRRKLNNCLWADDDKDRL